MIVYQGVRTAGVAWVWVVNTITTAKGPLPPWPWMAVDGWCYDWGCWCPGSLHLSIAMLVNAAKVCDQTAVAWSQALLEDVVLHLPKKGFMVPRQQVQEWLQDQSFRSISPAIGGRLNGQA